MIDTVVATGTPSSTFDRALTSVCGRDADDLDRLAASLHALAYYSYGEPFVVEASKHLGLEPMGLPDQLRFPVHCSTLIPPRREHHPALPYGEVPAFMEALRRRDAVAARALEFTILTAARTVDTLGATWGEVDLTTKTWIIPIERTQADPEHKIPLSDRAVEIVREMAAIEFSDFIFAGVRGGLSSMAMLRVLARLGRSDLTVSGFRSTFRNWAAESTAYSNHVIEMALARRVSNEVVAPYRQRDLFVRRAKLMNDWAEYCTMPGPAAQSRQKSLKRLGARGRIDRRARDRAKVPQGSERLSASARIAARGNATSPAVSST
jgi:integrase